MGGLREGHSKDSLGSQVLMCPGLGRRCRGLGSDGTSRSRRGVYGPPAPRSGMTDRAQRKETGGLLFVLAGVAGFVFLLTIVVIWALAYGPLS
ncbi:hypothetical protein GCM10009000_039570 [Halobacterium noricense]